MPFLIRSELYSKSEPICFPGIGKADSALLLSFAIRDIDIAIAAASMREISRRLGP